MHRLISIRAVQLALGMAYAALAAVAIFRDPSAARLAVCAGLAIWAYLTGRSLPDVRVPLAMLWRVAGGAVFVLACGVAADSVGGAHAVGWAAVVMALCAGNRFKAAGLAG